MTAKRRKKNVKLRGSHTHGYGSKKKHRGSGSRGGVGMAGTGKRADTKKTMIWKDHDYFGKHGFKKKNIKEKIKPITIISIEQSLKSWAALKIAEEKGGAFEIDLGKAGYNKLLSTGRATKKMNISVKYASSGALEKIKAAGGSVKLAVKPAPKQKAEIKEEKE